MLPRDCPANLGQKGDFQSNHHQCSQLLFLHSLPYLLDQLLVALPLYLLVSLSYPIPPSS